MDDKERFQKIEEVIKVVSGSLTNAEEDYGLYTTTIALALVIKYILLEAKNTRGAPESDIDMLNLSIMKILMGEDQEDVKQAG